MRKINALFTLLIFMSNMVEARDLQVGTNIWPGYEPLYLAENHMPGFDSIDVDVRRFFNASEVRYALEAGLIDVAALTLDEAVMAAANGMDISIIAVMDVSMGADKICTTLSEFEPKNATIAYEATALGGYFLSKFLKHINAGLVDVMSIEDLPVDSHLEAINSNRANTFVTFEPFATYLEDEGCREIYNSSIEPYMIVDVLVLNNDSVASRDVSPKQVKNLMKAWFWAVSKVNARDSFSMDEIALGLGVSVSELVDIYSELMIPDATENFEMFDGKILNFRINEIFNYLHKTQRLREEVSADRLGHIITNKYITK